MQEVLDLVRVLGPSGAAMVLIAVVVVMLKRRARQGTE